MIPAERVNNALELGRLDSWDRRSAGNQIYHADLWAVEETRDRIEASQAGGEDAGRLRTLEQPPGIGREPAHIGSVEALLQEGNPDHAAVVVAAEDQVHWVFVFVIPVDPARGDMIQQQRSVFSKSSANANSLWIASPADIIPGWR